MIELLMVVVITAVGLSLAAPAFTGMVANYRVRNAAEGVLNGLNYARAEAVRRNSPVSFALNGGAGWSVSQVSPSTAIQSRSNADLPGITAVSSTAATSVTFTPVGLVQSGTQLAQVTVSSGVAAANTRRISIFGGGLIRMCDPAVVTAGDARRC